MCSCSLSFGGSSSLFPDLSICTDGEGARCCRRKGWFAFLVFFLFCLVGTLVGFVVCRWMLAGGCLVFVDLKLFDLFSLLVVVEVMFAQDIGGDGSVAMVVMDHIWVRL